MRIFVPDEARIEPSTDAMKDDGEEKVEGEDGDAIPAEAGEAEGEEGEEEEQETAAQQLLSSIQSKVGVSEALKPFATFNLNFQVPRGKYDVEMFQTYVQHRLIMRVRKMN